VETCSTSTRRLYLCVGHRDDLATFLPAVLRGGVDVVQLREKDLDPDESTEGADAGHGVDLS
jgi:thiamine monophosphate synthase